VLAKDTSKEPMKGLLAVSADCKSVVGALKQEVSDLGMCTLKATAKSILYEQ
jgi:hypothetical protein